MRLERDHTGMLFVRGVAHEPGERCAVTEFAHARFGPELGEYLLWEFTCFPMSDGHAMAQLLDLAGAQELGRLGNYLRLQGHVQERAMREAAAA